MFVSCIYNLYIPIVQKEKKKMTTIAVSELRANLMKVLKEIKSGDSIHITSRGKVIAKLVPPEHDSEDFKKRLKKLRKTAVLGDLLSPVDEEWEAIN